MGDVWSMVHAERAALVHDLEGLDAPRWETPSLCAGWTVHDVVAHLVDTARTTRLGFAVGLVRARFDFDRQNARGVQRTAVRPRGRRCSGSGTSYHAGPLPRRRWTAGSSRRSSTARTSVVPWG